MDIKEIIGLLKSKSQMEILSIEGTNNLQVHAENWQQIAPLIKDHPELSFDYLMCITASDNGNSKEFTVAYNFYSTSHKHEVEIRIIVKEESELPSIAHLWKAADWHEREAFDLMGIKFTGHPDLKRILLSDDWESHPLRKNYKEPDYYHGVPVPKDKSYWE
jgi:NADH-quinone oxidoreductase subunit C